MVLLSAGPRSRLLAVVLAIGAGCSSGAGKDTADDTDRGAPPVATIVLPADGALLNTPDAITLRGTGVDPEQGDLTGADLRWESDVDGDLGTGLQVVTVLQPGPHRITLTATDEDGLTGTDEVSVTVTAENEPPVPTILEPDDGAYVREGATVHLVGAGVDPEDGDLDGPGLQWRSDQDGVLGTGAELDVTGLALGDHVLVLTAIDSQGAEASTAIALHVVGVGVDTPPVAMIDAPADGAAFTFGEVIRLEGHASDLEDGALTTLTWTSSAAGPLGSGLQLDVADLAQGVHVLTATATDSAGQPGSDSVTITVNAVANNQPPTAVISGPPAGAIYEAGEVVTLTGRGDDPEDGPLRGAALAWSSSIDGAVGTGSPLDLTTLSIGAHTVQLVVTDGDGAVGVASTNLFILAPNLAPTPQIAAPADGTHAFAGSVVTFQGSANDPEDGPLTGPQLVWQSNLDGPIGTGERIDVASLRAGAHQITLTAVDTDGETGSTSIGVVIDVAPAPIPPSASLAGAQIAYIGVPWTADGSASSDADGRVLTWAFDWGDGTPDTVGGSATASHTFAAAGQRTVTLTVTDDDGLTGATTLPVDVQIPIRVPEVVDDGVWPVGGFCDIALDAQDQPAVLYANLGYHQVWYAFERGGAWVYEMVDGPGFGIGGPAGAVGALVFAPNGTPHAAWLVDDTVRYGVRAGGVWTVETVATGAATDGNLAIALDPSHADRPTVAFTDSTSAHVTVSYRTGAGAWTPQTWTRPVGNTGSFRGGMAFTPGGAALLTVGADTGGVVSWQQPGGFSGFQAAWDDGYTHTYRVPLAYDAAFQALVAWERGVEHQRGATWIHDTVANSNLQDVDLAWDPVAGAAVALFRNDQGLVEIIRPGARQYWDWEYQGEMDAGTDPGLAVDSQGEARACLFRSGNLVVY